MEECILGILVVISDFSFKLNIFKILGIIIVKENFVLKCVVHTAKVAVVVALVVVLVFFLWSKHLGYFYEKRIYQQKNIKKYFTSWSKLGIDDHCFFLFFFAAKAKDSNSFIRSFKGTSPQTYKSR